MDNLENFKPMNEEERKFVDSYNKISQNISIGIRNLKVEERLPFLRDSKPSDLSLMNLYLQALKKEDYETCTVAKALLIERGVEIPAN